MLIELAIRFNFYKELQDLIEWNNNQKDRPLDNFNRDWLDDNAIIESDYLYDVAIKVGKELGQNHAFLINMILSEYGVIYAKLAIAAYYEQNNQIDLAISYYQKCLLDHESKHLAKQKLRELLNR